VEEEGGKRGKEEREGEVGDRKSKRRRSCRPKLI